MDTILINSDLSSANSADRRHQHYGNSTLSPAYPYFVQGGKLFGVGRIVALGNLEEISIVAFRSATRIDSHLCLLSQPSWCVVYAVYFIRKSLTVYKTQIEGCIYGQGRLYICKQR